MSFPLNVNGNMAETRPTRSSSRSHVSRELQDKLDRRLRYVEGESEVQQRVQQREKLNRDAASSGPRPNRPRDRTPPVAPRQSFSIADTPPITPDGASPKRTTSFRRDSTPISVSDRASFCSGSPAVDDDLAERRLNDADPEYAKSNEDDADPDDAESDDDEDDAEADEEDEQLLEYFMLTFASRLDGSEVAAFLDKVRHLLQRHSDIQGSLKEQLAAALQTPMTPRADMTPRVPMTPRPDVEKPCDDSPPKLTEILVEKIDSSVQCSMSNDALPKVTAALVETSVQCSMIDDSLPKAEVTCVETSVQCAMSDDSVPKAKVTCVETSVQCAMIDDPSVETLRMDPPAKKPLCAEVSVQCSILEESEHPETPCAARPTSQRWFLCRFVHWMLLCIFVPVVLAFLLGVQTGEGRVMLCRGFVELERTAVVPKMYSSVGYRSIRSSVCAPHIEGSTHHGLLPESSQIMGGTTDSQSTIAQADFVAATLKSFEAERQALKDAAASNLTVEQSLFQAQLQAREDFAKNVSAGFEVERAKLHAVAAQVRETLQAQVHELELAAANRTSRFEAEREQLQKNASLEQAAMQAQNLAQLQERHESARNASAEFDLEREQLHAVAAQAREALQAQVQELEVLAANRTSSFEAEREQLRKKCSLEQAEMQSRCLAQLQERNEAAKNGSAGFESERQHLHAVANEDREALQAQVKELEASVANVTSHFEAECDRLRKNASLEQVAMQAKCQTQLQEQKNVAVDTCSSSDAKRQKDCAAQLQELEAACAKRTADSDVEREQLQASAAADQSRCQVQLQELNESCARISAGLEEKCGESSAVAAKENQELLARLLTLEADAAKNASVFAEESDGAAQGNEALLARLQMLEANAAKNSTDLAALQEQTKELQDAAKRSMDEATKCEELRSTSSQEQAMMQAKLRDLENAVPNEDMDDMHQNCSIWEKAGKCQSSPEIMHVVCKTSCKSSSFDKTLGEGWTLDPNRPQACCCDHNEFCVEWAEQGQCESNAVFMKLKCQHACGMCGTTKETAA